MFIKTLLYSYIVLAVIIIYNNSVILLWYKYNEVKKILLKRAIVYLNNKVKNLWKKIK